jgi:hypothetical protein
MEIDLETRYRSMRTLWLALLVNVGIFFIWVLFSAKEISSDPGDAPDTVLIGALSALAVISVIASFVVKRLLLKRAEENQDAMLVQRALIVACTMCEVSVLIGVVARMTISFRQYYLLLLVGAIGIALHYPRRDHLLAAAYKNHELGTRS